MLHGAVTLCTRHTLRCMLSVEGGFALQGFPTANLDPDTVRRQCPMLPWDPKTDAYVPRFYEEAPTYQPPPAHMLPKGVYFG